MNPYSIEKKDDQFLIREFSSGNVVWSVSPEPGPIVSYGPGPDNMVWFMNARGDMLSYDVVTQRQVGFTPYKKLPEASPPPPTHGVKIRTMSSGSAGSWFGGRPKLPQSLDWPNSGAHSYLFVGQIDCSQLPSDLWGGIGPRTGWLAIFASHHEALDAKALYFSDLGRERQPPANILQENMMFDRIGQAPPYAVVGFVDEADSAGAMQAGENEVGKFGRRKSVEVARMDIEPTYYTSGYPGGDPDLAVLLDIPTSDYFGWQWGDVNNLTLLIRRQALQNNDFSTIICELSEDTE